ncbi:MAG: 16S rRNA (adenine(1518)-N(6)/adenine(1519)-N(6))-dimethyltransferase RsmA [Patescibacteria group bacterium]
MNLTSPRTVKTILAKHEIKPSKGLGQNFLVDGHVVHKLVAAAQVGLEDTVLEIGPGIGTLTQELAKVAKKVIAVEKDQKMVEILKETLAQHKNIEIIYADALKSNYKLKTTNYKLVANLPYYITAPAIRKFLEGEEFGLRRQEARLQTMTLIVQKEVAQRICAKPPEMSILAVSVQIYATPKIISYIKGSSFWPKPKVDAAILQITPFPQPYPIDFPRFFTIVKAGFKQPRKQLVNNLSKELDLPRQKTEQWLLENNIQPTQRAETLSIQDWINLTNMV